jgi:hypothetical protein
MHIGRYGNPDGHPPRSSAQHGRSHLHQYLRRHLAGLLRLSRVVPAHFVVGSTGLNSGNGLPVPHALFWL